MLNITKNLKDYFWPKFSIMVRQRGMDENGMNECVTCGRLVHWSKGDAGHWIAGRGNFILFHPWAVNFQCKPCNGGFMNSAPEDVQKRYDTYMALHYGGSFRCDDMLNDIRQKNRKPLQFTPEMVMRLILGATEGWDEYERVFFEIMT